MESNLDSLVEDLDEVLINLASFDSKIKNVVVLKEKLEAVQEERISGIIPEKIYKLLRKGQRSQQHKFSISVEDNDNRSLGNSNVNIWHKIVDFRHRFRNKKTVVSVAILASLSFGWMAGYYSSANTYFNNHETFETIQK